MHFYTATDSGLVQFGNARWVSSENVMERNDDIIKEVGAFFIPLVEQALFE